MNSLTNLLNNLINCSISIILCSFVSFKFYHHTYVMIVILNCLYVTMMIRSAYKYIYNLENYHLDISGKVA